MKRIASAVLVCCVLWCAPQLATAQAMNPNASSPVVQINPLGFLQFGPNLEVAVPVSEMVSLTPGVRIASLGLLPYLFLDENESLDFSWTASITAHIYPEAVGMQGFYVGPRFEFGTGATTDDVAVYKYDSTILVGAADFGYRWVYDSGMHLTFGAQTGALLDSWEGTDGTSGQDGYIFAMLVLGVGLAL